MSSEKKIRILLIENDIDFVYLIRKTIEQTDDLMFCTYAENGYAGLELARKLRPDIVLTDLNLTGNNLDGIEVSRQIRLSTNAKVLLLTSFEDPSIVILPVKNLLHADISLRASVRISAGSFARVPQVLPSRNALSRN